MLCCLSHTVLVRENSLYRQSLRQNPRNMIKNKCSELPMAFRRDTY